MGLTDNLCMNCFEKLTSGSVCRNCGFDNDSVTRSEERRVGKECG